MSPSRSVITLAVHERDPHSPFPSRSVGRVSTGTSDAATPEPPATSWTPPPAATSGPRFAPEPPASAVHRFDLAAEYDAHGAALFGYAINSLHDRGLAEDCVQETFLRAWRARETFDGSRASARTWLFAIERNVIVDLRRSMSRVARLVSSEPVEDVAADAGDELERLRVVEAVAKLTAEHREVVVAVHLVGESYAELSARSGVPVATLRTRAFYALRALRAHLDDPPEHFDDQEVRHG